MPLIRIEYDDEKVSDKEIQALSIAIREVVSHTTGIPDVFVYGNSARIKVQIAPIEIFMEMSAQKIDDVDVLFQTLTADISKWKRETAFAHPINFTLIPMQWKFAVNI